MRVNGQGPLDATLMLIGEAPGADEDRTGLPFQGKSGRELNRFLNGYQLPHRDEVFVTNICRQRPPGNRDPKPEEIARDLPELIAELEIVQPRVIVTLGRFATRHFLGDVTVEQVHGIPQLPPFTVIDGGIRSALPYAIVETSDGSLRPPVIFPAYHPAFGLHSPEMQALFAYDMEQLGLFLKGKIAVGGAVDEWAGREGYTLADTQGSTAWMDTIAIDTEGSKEHPWCLSYSGVSGVGTVIKPTSPVLEGFRQYLVKHRPRVILHNALYDLSVLKAMRVEIADDQFTDTMIMAYLLCLEPQGLKPLAFRHAGMRMSDYADIIGPTDERIVRDYLDYLRSTVATGIPEKQKGKKAAPLTLEQKTCRKVVQAIDRVLRPSRAKVEKSTRQRWQDSVAGKELTLPPVTLDDVEQESPGKVIHYACRDADATLRIAPILEAKIDAMGLRDALNADLGAVPMIARMQEVGLLVDLDHHFAHYKDLSHLLDLEVQRLDEWIWKLAGRPFNVASSEQVADMLFGQLGLQGKKKTKSGDRFSTVDKVLEAIKGAHPIIQHILDRREAAKLKGTYVDKIPSFVAPDGRLHPRYRITRVASGRLAAADPNVLAFPKHSALGRLVRAGIVVPPGVVFGEWDLDQIEMRVMAHDSGDEQMVAEILSGVDKHRATASLIFGKKAQDINGEERFAAKAVNFGVLMGITEHGLLDQFHKNGQTHWTQDACAQLLAEWFRAYPGVRSYIYGKHAEARRYGYVRDMWGRVRYLPGVHSDDKYIREEALRQAQATPIQSGAQGIVKRWMALVWREMKGMWRDGFYVEPNLQVHDALLCEFQEDLLPLVDAVMLETLKELPALRVPVTAKGTTGRNWGEV